MNKDRYIGLQPYTSNVGDCEGDCPIDHVWFGQEGDHKLNVRLDGCGYSWLIAHKGQTHKFISLSAALRKMADLIEQLPHELTGAIE